MDIVLADTRINILTETNVNNAGRKRKTKSINKIRKNNHSATSDENNKKNIPNKEKIALAKAIKKVKAVCNPNSEDNNIIAITKNTNISDESVFKRFLHFGY